MILNRLKAVNSLYFFSFVCLGFIGLLSIRSYNLAPANAIFEVVFLVSALLIARPLVYPLREIFIVAAAYFTIKLALMIAFNDANILDFLQAYKAFLYVLPLCFFVGRGCFDYRRLALLVKVLLVLFFLKYSYSRLLEFDPRMATRPGLFVENNFELIMLMGLFYLAFWHLGKWRNVLFLVMCVIVAMSGSRSALLALLVVYPAIYIQRLTPKLILTLLGLALIALSAFFIFIQRTGVDGLQDIDRYKFALIFIHEIKSWSALNYLFGSFPITALSPGACSELAFYSGLFSRDGTGACYSVILHSYILRVIFDHGVLGLSFILGFSWFGLRRGGLSRRDALCILSIIFVSALSVSAFNSIYVAILLAYAFGSDKVRPLPIRTEQEFSAHAA